MRKLLGGLVLAGAAAGAGFALRNYLRAQTEAVAGEIRIILDSGAEIEPDPPVAREFVDITRRVLEIAG